MIQQPSAKVVASYTIFTIFHNTTQCTEVRFASFLPGGFITATLVNPTEKKQAKRTSVQWFDYLVFCPDTL